MVAFYLPENKAFSLEAEYLGLLGLGDCDLRDGLLHALNDLTDAQIAMIEAEGLKRADTHHYNLRPIPERKERSALVRAFNQEPITTRLLGADTLKISFVKALDAENIEAVQTLGYDISEI